MPVKFSDVEEQYKKNKDLKKEDVVKLREWLILQPHLPNISELQTILFLYSCYNSNEAAKKCIDNFYTVKTHCPEFFTNQNPANEDIQLCLRSNITVPLPKLTPEGHCIFYAKLIDPNPDVYNFNVGLKVFDMVVSLYLQEMGALQGHIIIIDLKGATLTHVLKTSVVSVKKFMFFLQEALPFRLKSLHFTNAVPFMDKILALIKPFMKKELVDIIHQGNSDTIFKTIPKDCLPIELGGTLGTDLEVHANFMKKMQSNTDFYREQEKLVVDESKRPGKPKDLGEIFGVEGTFKKLDID